MSKSLVVSVVALLVGLTLSPVLSAQTAAPKSTLEKAYPEWNSLPPIKPAYAGRKSAPAPRRDLSGVWDAAEADEIGRAHV